MKAASLRPRTCWHRAGFTGLVGAVFLALLSGGPVAGESLIDTSTESGHYSAAKFYTHYVDGYYWVAFNKDTQAVLYSSRDAVTWTSQGTIFGFTFPSDTNYWAVRYLGNRIVAVAFNTGDNTRYYRQGTLDGAGGVSWSAAAPAGPADPTDPDLNVLVTGDRPVVWRAGPNGNGAFWRGTSIVAPSWAALAGSVPGHGLVTGFTAGAVFPTGGADPDDLIVLRAFTQSAYAGLGEHRLLALKWNDGLGAYDGSWYDVSTLGSTLTEDTSTEVQTGDDAEVQRKFTAVADSSGNIHALYATRANQVAHYRKAVGFNNLWSRVTADVLSGDAAAKVAVGALTGGQLILFYEKNAAQRDIWYRVFDGSTWGTETLLFPGASLGLDLRRALAPLERTAGCASGLAFTAGSTPPFDVDFSLGVGGCGTLTTVENTGAGTVTVTGLASFEMRFNRGVGGSIDQWFELDRDPGRSENLMNNTGLDSQYGLNEFAICCGPDRQLNGEPEASVQLLEATPTRVRVRAVGQLGGDAGYGYAQNTTLLGTGRLYNRLVFTNTTGVALNKQVNWYNGTDYSPEWKGLSPAGVLSDATEPLAHTNAWALRYADNPTPGDLHYANALFVPYETYAEFASSGWNWKNSAGDGSGYVKLAGDEAIADGASLTFTHNTVFKPDTIESAAAAQPFADDYRGPGSLGILVGTAWQDPDENTGSDHFNEAEGAYLLTAHPTNGLRFTMDGAATSRLKPFFKIRYWRSLSAPGTITFDPDSVGAAPSVTLNRGLHYLSDVKPVSRAHFADDLRWHSTLESGAAVTAPGVGGAGSVVGAPAFGAARYGSGVSIGASTQYVGLPTSDFDPALGALEFWFRPTFDSTDGIHHDICGFSDGIGDVFVVEKAASGNLNFVILLGGTASQLSVLPVDYRWRPGDWVHLRIEWDDAQPLATQQRLFLNGVEPAHTDPVAGYVGAGLTVQPFLRFGNIDGDGTFAPGLFDEIRLYGSSSTTPSPLSHGGLASDAAEYLGDTTRNFTLGLTPVDGTGRGEYAYFGSDSKYRGLNVLLATEGATGGTLDLQWEYWNGTAWTGLTVTDETNALTETGSLYWTGDPAGWAPYSVNGGPDLYYVRAHLSGTSASYSTSPVEGLVTTDVLLFQYCGDVTTANAEFSLSPPVPTAVELVSLDAIGTDSAVELAWRTASELDNLGFHLYRSLSPEGLWSRITPSLIPGLGSSPEGASYSFRDTGLVNGRAYYYRLEDIDSMSGSTFHGPVVGIPGASSSSSGSEEEEGGEGSTGSGEASGEGDEASFEDASGAGDTTESTHYGSRGEASLRILKRTARSVVLELRTPGFFATESRAGVRVSVPGFDERRDPRAPALPLKRALLDGVVGRHGRIVWVKEKGVQTFAGLRPSAVGSAEVVYGADGTLHPARVETPMRRSGQIVPRLGARIAGDAFIGKDKKLALELSPLRYDGGKDTLRLARELRVKVAFDRRAWAKERGRGSRGLRRPRRTEREARRVLAHLHTLQTGLHAVPFEALGLSRGIPRERLRLSLLDETVPHHVEPEKGDFGPGSVLLFHAFQEASSLEHTSETTWALESTAEGGREMGLQGRPRRATGLLREPALKEERYETNRFYQAGLLEAPDIWLWDFVVGGMSKSVPFFVRGLEAGSGEASQIQVFLQGASESATEREHHLSVSVNGTLVGETWFGGKLPHVLTASVAGGVLVEGENTLMVTNLGDTGGYSYVFLDRFGVVYPCEYGLEGGRFEGSFRRSGLAVVEGEGLYGVDVTDPESPRWLRLGRRRRGKTLFLAESGHRYAVVSAEGLRAPRVSRPLRSDLRKETNGADYVVIAPRAFLEAAEPLIQRRREQGLRALGVSFEEVVSEFGHGRPSGEGIRDFLAYAYHHWGGESLRYVLLLGDGSYDPRNFTGLSQGSPLPVLWAKTSYLVTSSDPTLGAVNGEDGLSDVAVGRLPARTEEEARSLVRKVLDWEEGGRDLSGRAILVADDPDEAGDFEADVRDIQESLLQGRETRQILLREHGGNTRDEILRALDAGASLVSYVGHGGPAVWASENVLNSWDPPKLLAQSEQPLMLTFNCLNGYFVAPSYDSLSEAFLKAEGRGTIGAFSPSGLSLDAPAHRFHRVLVGEIASGRHARLGDAVLAAQKAYAETGLMPELLAVYHLLADPALTITP